MYAIIEVGSKQYEVAVGEVIKVEKLSGQVGDEVELNCVLMIRDSDGVKVGKPVLENAKVLCEVLRQDKDKKIKVFKFKKHNSYHRTRGHRQAVTFLKVKDIVVG